MRYHSPIAQAAYHDLLSHLLDEAVSEMRGSPAEREINGKIYWYDRYRVGTDVRSAISARTRRRYALESSASRNSRTR